MLGRTPHLETARSSVELRPVTVDNWQACAALELRPDQVGFLPSNLYSLAEAQFYPEGESLTIYALPNELVGFARYGRDAASGEWKIFRLMIDRDHQEKGYGRAAVQGLIERLATYKNADCVLISYGAHNHVARRLNRRLGFAEYATDAAGKVTARLVLR